MSEKDKGFDVLKLVRDARDGSMDAWAKLTLNLTSSHEYQRLQGFFVKPVLLAIALVRKATDSTMSGVLGNLNMPSRDEVLGISQRLTHIEMALDDLAAGLDQLRRTASPSANRPQRPSGSSGRGSDVAGENRAPISAKEA
jgi:hypothetical protein